MVRVKTAICDTVRRSGGRIPQADLQRWLQEYSEKEKGLKRLAQDNSEDAFLFVFGALIQLMSEKVIITDPEDRYYILTPSAEA